MSDTDRAIDEISALFEGRKKKSKSAKKGEDEIPIQVQINSQYRVFDLGGNVPFSIVFGLVRRSSSDTDPRSLVVEVRDSVLDVPYALATGLLTLHTHEDDREVPIDLSRVAGVASDDETTSVIVPSPVGREQNWKQSTTVYEYRIQPSSVLGSLFEVGKDYSIRVHPGNQDSAFKWYGVGEQDGTIHDQKQKITTIAHGRAYFKTAASVPIPPILQTRMRLCPAATSEESQSSPQLEISVTNTGAESITVQTRGRQRFLVPQGPILEAEGAMIDDTRPRIIDATFQAPYLALQVVDITTTEVIKRAAQPGPCGGAQNPKKGDDTRPRLDVLVTINPGEPLVMKIEFSQLFSRISDGKYGVQLEPRGMWWCLGDRRDFAVEDDDRVPHHLWRTWILPVLLKCDDTVEVQVRDGRLVI